MCAPKQHIVNVMHMYLASGLPVSRMGCTATILQTAFACSTVASMVQLVDQAAGLVAVGPAVRPGRLYERGALAIVSRGASHIHAYAHTAQHHACQRRFAA